MKTALIVILLVLIAFSAFGQQLENVFLGKWTFQYMTHAGQLVNGGTIVFFADSYCKIVTPKSATDYDYSFDKTFVFVSDFGYYYEILDNKHIKLIPGFDADIKYLLFTKVEK